MFSPGPLTQNAMRVEKRCFSRISEATLGSFSLPTWKKLKNPILAQLRNKTNTCPGFAITEVWIMGHRLACWILDHRYGSCPLKGYGSWVWSMGYGSHVVPGYGSEPYILSCSKFTPNRKQLPKQLPPHFTWHAPEWTCIGSDGSMNRKLI